MSKRRSRVPAVLVAVSLLALAAGCGGSDPVAELRSLQEQGRFEDSLEPARALAESRPDDPEVLYLYGRALVRTRQMSLAQFPLRKAMESPDWLVKAGLELAAAELASDNAESAIEVSGRILEAQPEHLEALLLRARARAESRRSYDEALADVDRALALDPGNFEAMMLRAVSLLGLEQVAEAEKQLEALEGAAADADSKSDLGTVCAMRALLTHEKGDSDAAETRFDACLEKYPTDGSVLQQSLKFFDGRGKGGRSLEILRKALAEAPSSSEVRRVLASRLRERGESAEAERVLREGTALENPQLAQEAWVDLANHLSAVGDDAGAVAALEQAIALGGDQVDPQLRFFLADAQVMAGRYDDALAAARQLGVPAQRAMIEGRVALEQGRGAEALAKFDEGLRLWPDNAVARYYAALAAEAVANYDRAIAELRYAIRAGEHATDARLRLARLHLAEGAYSLALAAAMHDATGSPPGIETDLLGMRAAALAGNAGALRGSLARFEGQPVVQARMVAAAADGLRERRGPAAALRLLRGAQAIDYADPAQADALRVLVLSLAQQGDSAGALAAARAAVAKHPEAAVFHAIEGRGLAATGAPPAAVRAAFERALARDPKLVEALEGLAQQTAADGDAAGALALYARAAEADPERSAPLRAAAEILLAQGKVVEAEAKVVEAVERDPYDGRAAALLATQLVERGGDLDRALVLATASARFGGGAPAQELIARVHEKRGEPELAKAAREKAAAKPAAAPAPGPELELEGPPQG